MKDSTMFSGDSSPAKPLAKKKRNLPGTPDPDAEVIALSPKTLLATNRFVCEICNKGFQRDQNLQLHRRGHNLPWKLRQRSGSVKKRVYICPELGCVHHDPSRALGDLTGIKKHFCRKHGEKKWKCDKCSKKYAVQSDWKAHSKVCGTREYRCDCGTLFSRRDSFVTHRAFCDPMAEENAKAETRATPPSSPRDDSDHTRVASPLPAPTLPQPPVAVPAPCPQQPSEAPAPLSTPLMPSAVPVHSEAMIDCTGADPVNGEVLEENSFPAAGCSNSSSSSNSLFASLFVSSASSSATLPSEPSATRFNNYLRAISHPIESLQSSSSEAVSLCLSTNQSPLMFASSVAQYAPSLQPAMSATALLQKAAQMGPTSSKGSLLRGLGLVCSSPSDHDWNIPQIEPPSSSVAAGLRLAIGDDEDSGFKEFMMGTRTVFGPKQTTLDFLGLGVSARGGSPAGLPAVVTSINRGQMPRYSTNGAQYAGDDMGGRS